MNQNLAIIGASYLQLPLIEKAKEMGYITHVFAWAAEDVGEKVADHFYPISIVEKEAILKVCREIGICGICSIASDLAMLTVNYVAQSMNLTGNTPEATVKSTNKHQMRLAFEAGNVPSPRSILVDESTDLSTLHISYPVIVKPTDRSGSRGIFKLQSSEGLPAAIKSAMQEGFEKKVLVEEYAEGQEYSVEHISYHGKHSFLALTLKHTTGAPHFIETGHLEPAPVNKHTLKKVQEVVSHALDVLGIENGASHAELKIAADGTIRMIEIGGRMGGDCIGSDLVRYSTGLDFVKMVIQVACGKEPNLTPVCAGQPVESVFIFTPSDLQEFQRLQRDEPDQLLKIVDFHPENIGHITDSSNRAGCYIRKARHGGNK
ncbi:ATP-grasp domain-containing protein [Pygmaiobacter massiliensis]|uniref:ATP-grasp domain-containing protein n=1 Tax=Pygmaiobacter massiliensis TaxID=1917873 RepID=UPI002A7EF29F|nr:ATP-grasp domain-containing protein [Pygmaiobacter massiliensis]MDY4784950.1 ATP-grasp domain-containing protein [Pygmaiobacter massiliensis]